MRTAIAAAAISLSIIISGCLLYEGVSGLAKSDSAITETFRGAAQEDVFGFGFWFTWTLIAALQLVLLVISAGVMPTQLARIATGVAGLVFVCSSLVWYLEFERAWNFWLAWVSAS